MSELLELTKQLLTRYFIGEKESVFRLLNMLENDSVIIGTGEQEFHRSMQEFQNALSLELQEREDKLLQLKDLICEEKKISEDVSLIYGKANIWWENETKTIMIDMHSRFSILYKRVKDMWKIVHVHLSTPNPDQMIGESYPKTLVNQVVTAQEMIESLTQLAETDALTGLINIRTLKEKYASAKKENSWLFAIDIDNFKRVNDLYGHLSGDQALKKLADILSSAMRKDDYVCRMGGDEFLLLCNNITTKEVASKLATRLLMEVQTQSKTDARLSGISIGFTKIKEDEPFEDAFQRADYALYASKRSGKGKATYQEI